MENDKKEINGSVKQNLRCMTLKHQLIKLEKIWEYCRKISLYEQKN